MQDSIFTKIIKGEVPSYKIYEDTKTFAFLDINPVEPGHTLVVPKSQVEFVWDLDETDYLTLMTSVRKIAHRVKEVMGKPYVGEMIVGTDVPHAHVHIVPFTESRELHKVLDPNREPDHEVLAKIADQLRMEDEL